MARYIDADALIEQLKEADRNCPNDIIKCCIGLVQTQPTAYDVEAKVAELEKLKEEYEHHCIHGAWQRGAIDGAKIALSKAISIVRGKE